MHTLSACQRTASCLAYRDIEFRKPAAFTWNSPCISCVEGFARRMDSWKPEPDPHDTQSQAAVARRNAACRQGHLRSEHGRRQIKGRDAGQWACRECERIKREKRLEREKYKCVDCGKTITPGAVQCVKCRRKDKKAAQPVYCIIAGCRAKARRRGMCATHYWKTRGELKVEQRKARHREVMARHRAMAAG